MLSEEFAVFDNLKARLYLIVHADPPSPRRTRARGAGSTSSSSACAIRAPAIPTRSIRQRSTSPISAPPSPATSTTRSSRRRRNPSAAAISPARPGAAPAAVSRAAGRCLARVAGAEPFALHVLPRSRGRPSRRLLARDPGAAERRRGHRAADCRHPSARRDPRSRIWRWKPSSWPTRRSAPST